MDSEIEFQNLRCILFCLPRRMCPVHQPAHAPLHTRVRTKHTYTHYSLPRTEWEKSKITHSPQPYAGADARGGTDLSKEKIPTKSRTPERNGTTAQKPQRPTQRRSNQLSTQHREERKSFTQFSRSDFRPWTRPGLLATRNCTN